MTTAAQPQAPTYTLKIVVFTRVGTFSGSLNPPTTDYQVLENEREELIEKIENGDLGSLTLVNERQMITVPESLIEHSAFAFEIIEVVNPPVVM